jgi:hypothetical protein
MANDQVYISLSMTHGTESALPAFFPHSLYVQCSTFYTFVSKVIPARFPYSVLWRREQLPIARLGWSLRVVTGIRHWNFRHSGWNFFVIETLRVVSLQAGPKDVRLGARLCSTRTNRETIELLVTTDRRRQKTD